MSWGEDTSGSGWGSTMDTPTESGDNNNNKSSGCRKCGDEGHFAKDCSKPDVCFKCKKEGHMSKDCDIPDTCRKCKQEGHMSRDCELPDKCHKCNQEGHMARDCSEPDKCRRCGEEGHMVKECTQEEKTRKVVKEDGTEGEIYVPKQLADSDLFETGISSGINFDKYDHIKVNCSGENVPKPIKSFEDAGLRTLIQENVKKCGYTKPTPIQKHAIPIILGKRDLMGCAQTGSGKTAAFLLPILHKILEDSCDPNVGASPQTPQALIVTPTRELAIQIKDEARKFAKDSILRPVVVYGGTSTGFQINDVRRGCNVLIATPGRLMDLVEKEIVSFAQIQFLVLDEADRMLDMGFKSEVERIVCSGNMPAAGVRQTLMFSATFPPDVQDMAKEFLKEYIFLAIGIVGGACSDVVQSFFQVEKFGKRDKLKEVLNDVGTDRTLVFVETKRNADFIAAYLCGEGLPTTSIHGDRLQREREEALADFKSGKFPILVATAVAARGLDIKGVKHVINYDLPSTIDEYVHRIGRTGRVGNIGKATSFFDNNGKESDLAADLVKILTDSQQEVPDFIADAATGGSGGGGGTGFGAMDIRGGGTAVVEEEEW